jgi:putative transposase
MPERPRRLNETFLQLPIYFITACTHKRQPCLNNLDIHQRLTEFGKAGEERAAWLGAFVLMPDHLHAFVIINDEQLKLSTWVKSLKNALSKVLREKDVPSPHWQKGFFDHILRSADSYSEKWEYVRENPVRAGLVTVWNDWPFSGESFDLEFRRNEA